MKIDNLISNLQKNTAEQDRNIKIQAENATKQHMASYNALLQKSLKQTENTLEENLQTIKDQQPNIKKALHLNTLKGMVLGVLVTLFLIFLGITAWFGYQIKEKKRELYEINLKIEQTPLERQALHKVKIVETQDKKSILIIARNSKKADAFENTNDQMLLKLEK